MTQYHSQVVAAQVYHKLTSRTALANTGTVFSFEWSSFGLCGRTNHPTDYASLSPCHAKLSQNFSSVSRLFQGRRAILRVSCHHPKRRRCAWCSLRRAVCRSRTRRGRDRGLDDGCYAQGAASRRLCGGEARWCFFFLSSSSLSQTLPDLSATPLRPFLSPLPSKLRARLPCSNSCDERGIWGA
jgi:hypothetical protein